MRTDDKQALVPPDQRPDGIAGETRRGALQMIGLFGAYTAPGMIALMTGQAYAQGSRFT